MLIAHSSRFHRTPTPSTSYEMLVSFPPNLPGATHARARGGGAHFRDKCKVAPRGAVAAQHTPQLKKPAAWLSPNGAQQNDKAKPCGLLQVSNNTFHFRWESSRFTGFSSFFFFPPPAEPVQRGRHARASCMRVMRNQLTASVSTRAAPKKIKRKKERKGTNNREAIRGVAERGALFRAPPLTKNKKRREEWGQRVNGADRGLARRPAVVCRSTEQYSCLLLLCYRVQRRLGEWEPSLHR